MSARAIVNVSVSESNLILVSATKGYSGPSQTQSVAWFLPKSQSAAVSLYVAIATSVSKLVPDPKLEPISDPEYVCGPESMTGSI